MDRLSTKVVCNFYLFGVLHATRYGEFHATDLSELTHTAEAGIARVGAFGAVEIVANLMSVIRTERYGAATGLLYFEHSAEELVGIEVALEGPFLVEVALFGLADGTQVHEVDPVTEAPHHADEVMLACTAEGACAETESVGGVGHGIDKCLEIFCGGEHARQTEDGHRRVIGVDDHLDAGFVRYGADLGEEEDEVRTEAVGIYILITEQLLAELLECERLFATRQTHDHGAGKGLFLGFGHGSETCFGTGDLFSGVIGFGTLTTEDEEVEGDVGGFLEHESVGAVGEDVIEVRACPIEHGHEVIRDHVDAACTEVTQGLLVVIDILEVVAFLRLDMLMYGHGLDTGPGETSRFDEGFAFGDLFDSPHFAVRDMVEGGDDTGSACHLDVGEGDGVVGTVPTHGLNAKFHCFCF